MAAQISDTRIANMALTHVGARNTIEELETGTSEEAVVCRLWYDYARKQVLEGADWSFARRRVAGTLHADTISEVSGQPYAGTWAFRYVYPENCVAVRKMQNPSAPPGDATPFEIELNLAGNEKTILTNVEEAVIVYTFDQEVPELYSPGFVGALSHLLGHYIAFTITGKRSISNDMLKKYQGLLAGASATDANEQVAPPPREGESIRARGNSGEFTVRTASGLRSGGGGI